MSLMKLSRKAIEARRLDADTVWELRRVMNRRPHLDPEEYEILRRLGQAVKSGEVECAY